MRLRTHALVSVVAGIAAYPRAPRRALLLAFSGVLVDADHYLLYALRSGDWNPLGALRYDKYRATRIRPGDTRPRYGSLRSMLHRATLTIPLVWLLSRFWPALRPVALGVTLHLALDSDLHLRLDGRALRRARGRCERCRVGGLSLGVYYRQRPRGRARWSLENRAVWCRTCAREVHSRSTRKPLG